MALDFPASPTIGQKYPAVPTAGVPIYTWDGEKWVVFSANLGAGIGPPATFIPSTPAGNLQSTNVQGALNELDAEKVAKAGDTMTGSLLVDGGGVFLTQPLPPPFGGDGDTGLGGQNIIMTAYSDLAAPEFHMYRTHGSLASYTSVAQGDLAGVIRFGGFSGDDNNWPTPAMISAHIDGPPSPAILPVGLSFWTGENAGVQRMYIGSGGAVTIMERLGIGLTPQAFTQLDMGTDRYAFNIGEQWYQLESYSDSQQGESYIVRSRGTRNAKTPVQIYDWLGRHVFGGLHGPDGANDWAYPASVVGYVDGPVSLGVLPSAVGIFTGNSGAGAQRVAFTSAGDTVFYNNVRVNSQAGLSSLDLNPLAPAQQALINFRQTDTYHWQLGKHTDNSFFLFDNVTPATVISIQSNGTTIDFGRPLLLPGDPTAPLHAATKAYVDAHAGGGGGGTGDALPLTGGTLTGNLKVMAKLGIGLDPIDALDAGDGATWRFEADYWGIASTTWNAVSDVYPVIYLSHQRGTQSAPLPNHVGDYLGSILAVSRTTTGIDDWGAALFLLCDAPPSGVNVPAAFAFQTGNNSATAATRLWIGSDGKVKLSNPVAITDADQVATKLYVDNAVVSGGTGAEFLPLTGGTLTGTLHLQTVAGTNGLGSTDSTTYEYAMGGAWGWTELDTYGDQPGDGPGHYLARGRGTLSAVAPVQVGDNLGFVAFGNIGAGANSGASIGGWVDGAVAGTAPTALTFSTGNNNGGVERMRITSGGTINIGLVTPYADEYTQLVMGNATRAFETSVWGDVTGYVELDLVGWGEGGFGGGIYFGYSRGTRDAQLPVHVGDEAGTIGYGFHDLSGGNRVSAQFKAIVDAAPAADGVPTAFVFSTGAAGNGGTERLRIASDGIVGISTALRIEPLVTPPGIVCFQAGGADKNFYVYDDVTGAGHYFEVGIVVNENTPYHGSYNFYASRGVSTATLPLQAGDSLGMVNYYGTTNVPGVGGPAFAYISAVADAVPNAEGTPTAIVFATAASGAGAVERFRIGSTGVATLSAFLDVTAPHVNISPATGGAALLLNTRDPTPQQSLINFTQAGTARWQVGNQFDNSFVIYDNVSALEVFKIGSAGTTIVAARPIVLPAADPAAATHAAHKAYVDARIATRAPIATVSTLAPSGGVDGDVWYQVT